MRVYIDNAEVHPESPAEDFSALLSEMTRRCLTQGRVIIGIDLDGVDLGNADLGALEEIDLARDAELRLATGSRKDVALGVLKQCADSIPRLVEAFSQAVGFLQQGDRKTGMAHIDRCVQDWVEVVGGVQAAVRTLAIDLEKVFLTVKREEDGVSAKSVVDRINDLLEETQRAFFEDDQLEIGDILEYDLPPLLRAFQESLYLMAQQAG